MADGAEHHVLLVEHRTDPRLHGVVCDDQATDILGPAERERRFRRAGSREPPRAVRQRVERSGNPAQDEPQQGHQHCDQDHGLQQQCAENSPLARRFEHPRDFPLRGTVAAQANDEQVRVALGQRCPEAWLALHRGGEQGIGLGVPPDNHQFGDIDTLCRQHLFNCRFAGQVAVFGS